MIQTVKSERSSGMGETTFVPTTYRQSDNDAFQPNWAMTFIYETNVHLFIIMSHLSFLSALFIRLVFLLRFLRFVVGGQSGKISKQTRNKRKWILFRCVQLIGYCRHTPESFRSKWVFHLKCVMLHTPGEREKDVIRCNCKNQLRIISTNKCSIHVTTV